MNTKLFAHFKEDFSASLVVFFVAIPLCLGIALASGAPLIAGLVAGIVGGIVAGSISGSPLGVAGPAAGMAVIVLSAIESLGFEAFLLAVVLAGVFQIGLGFARAGTLGNFVPSPVIKGMLTGIGIIIILKQLPHAVGFDADYEGDEAFIQPDGTNTFSSLMDMWNYVHPTAIFIALVAIGIMVSWESLLAPRFRFCKVLPGALVAVVFGVGVQVLCLQFFPEWAIAPSHLVNVPVTSSPGELFALLSSPDWSQITNKEVYTAAAIMAIVASLETLLSVEAVDKLDPYRRKTPPTRELFAQGAGNITSGLLGGLPITQVIVRSSANVQSGGQTKLSTIMHGFLILISLLTLPAMLNLIPLSVLASVLILTGYKLAKPGLFKDMYARGKEQFIPFIATVAGVVFTDLLTGISIGLAITIATLLYRNFINSHNVVRENNGGEEVIRLQLSQEVTFLNKSAILSFLENLPSGSRVCIDASQCFVIDNDVADTIKQFTKEAHIKNIHVTVVGSDAPLVKPRLALN